MIRFVPLLVVVGLVAASPVGAYRIDQDRNGHALHWSRMPVGWQMVTGNAPGGAAGEEAVKRAFRSWDDASERVQYVFDGFVASGRNEYDRRNLVYWIHDGWPYDANLVAVTARFYSNADGALLDADIVFNGERYAWSTIGVGYDVENAAAHEVGHFSGLGHSSDSQATMYASAAAGETKKRSLAGDDVAGLHALYGGSGSDGGEEPASPGGVASSPAQGAGSAGGGGCAIGTAREGAAGELSWLAFLLAALGARRRRDRGENRG